MKPITVFLLFIGFTQLLTAQPAKVSGKISYIYTLRQSLYIQGTADTYDTVWLFFNDTLSSFMIDTKIVVDEKKIAAQLTNLSNDANQTQQLAKTIADNYRNNRFQYSFHPGGTLLTYRPWVIQNEHYCRVDTLADFDWELTTDTTRILGFLCQKATSKKVWDLGVHRPFEAWYTTEIPLAYGPRNVFGLPGIVLQVDSKYVSYTAVQIKLPQPPEEIGHFLKCSGLPLIAAKEADKNSKNLIEDIKNMKRLREN